MHADLLTIGTHGRSGFDRFVLGSVAEKVLRKASCPVLTVPRQAPDAVPVAPVVFKRILCPIDFSDSSMHALNYAMSLAQEADASLTVLHVMVYDLEIEAPEMYETVLADRRLSVTDYRRRCEEHSRERLRAAVPETVGAYCTVEVLLASGKPYREILRVAAEQQTDLIVMGVQGRGAADLMVFGSTTQHVVRQATCPVLTIRKGNPSGSL
jgi:nucleotide-binding universal stress UspA family protein